MALPFNNGFELAQAMGFGDMYQASKQQENNNIQTESKNMNKAIFRMTESELYGLIRESVKKVLKEYGETPSGQRNLGALHARKVLRNNDLSMDTYKYAERSRGGDKYNNVGDNMNPMYKDYAKGYVDYLDAHPDEYVANQRRRRQLEN